MKKLLIKLLRFYKKHISAGLKTSCAFTPTCSEYAIEALEKRSFFVAVFLIIRRLLRCNPLAKGGLDPVPDSKNVVKWLI